MSGFFYNLGRTLGRKAVPAMRKSKWIWNGLTGTEEEAIKAECSFGAAMAAELRNSSEPLADLETQKLLADICARISACVRNKLRKFHCEGMREQFPNAIALPGGYIFVSHTLVQLCERNPDELAFVIAHEMSHVIRGHAWDRMLNESILRMASTVTARAGALGGWVRQQGFGLLRSGFSQECESEADELGLRLVLAAGYQGSGSIALMTRIQTLAKAPGEIGQYFASHPPAAERIMRLASLQRSIAPRV